MTVTDTRSKRDSAAIAPVALLVAGTLLAGCDSGQVPTDAVMSITPQERSIGITEFRDADGLCRTDGSRFVDVPMLLRLATSDGSPIPDADVEVYVDFAGNTYSGFPVLALFEDRNGNGIVDADAELASGAGDSIARVRTGGDGTHRLLLRADIACPYRGEVFAYAGATSAQASFEVTAEQTVEPEPPEPEPEPSAPRLPGTDADEGADATGGAGIDDADGASEGVETDPSSDDVDPFETVPDDTAPADGESPGGDGGVGGGDGAAVDGPAPQPVHCIEDTGRRTAVVCTVDPESGS